MVAGPEANARAAPAGRSNGDSERRAKQAQQHQQNQILLRLARPPPHAQAGGSALPRESFAVDVSAKPFQAARSLPLLAEPQAPVGKDGKAPPAKTTSPAAAINTFASAVDEAQSLYYRLVNAAREISANAVRENQRAGDKARDGLDRNFAELGRLLDENRITLDRSRDFAIEKVEVQAKKIRRRINAAAGSAFARLSEMRQVYEGLMSAPRSARNRITGELNSALSDTQTKAHNAHANLQAFSQAPETFLTLADFDNSADAGGEIMGRAQLEAALQYVVPYIDADDRATAERLTAIEGVLNPLSQCLPCQMDGAFQLLDMRMDSLMVAGPRAVAATRDGALTAVTDLSTRLVLQIEDTHSTLRRQFVTQHDRTRGDLSAQAKLEGQGEREDIHTTASRQVDSLLALAEGQSRGVSEAQQRLARDGSKSGNYTSMLLSGASRMRANIAGLRRRFPGEQLRVASAKTASRGKSRDAIGALHSRSLTVFDQALGEMVRSTFEGLNDATGREFLALHDTPDRVRSSCEGFLGPAEAARNQEVAALNSQVDRLGRQVTAAINGTNADAGGNAGDPNASTSDPAVNTCSAEPNMSVAPATATSSSGATASPGPAATGSGSGGGPAPRPMPPPASCSACPQASEGAGAGPDATTGDGPAATTTGSGGGETSTTTSEAPAASGPGGNYMSSVEFRQYCDEVDLDPTNASGVKDFITRVKSSVTTTLTGRAGRSWNALDHWYGFDGPSLIDSLRGLTAASGAALAEMYRINGHGSITNRINSKYDDAILYQWGTAPSTLTLYRDSALSALGGDITGATASELRAAINYSNDDTRIQTAMSSLTPAQMAAMPASELDAIASDLEGENLRRFNALRAGHGGGASEHAATLFESINRANASEGTARGRAVQTAISAAYNAQELAIEGPADRQFADVFGLENPEVKAARREGQWRATLTAFGQLDGVSRTLATIPNAPVSAMPGGAAAPVPAAGAAPVTAASGSTPASTGPANPDGTAASPAQIQATADQALQDALIRYATRDIYHPPPPPPPRSARAQDMDTGDVGPGRTDHLAPDMLNWIEQTVRHGPGSIQARGAQLLVEYNRASETGSAGRLDTTLNIGSANAREGAHYAPLSTREADLERDRVFDQFARFQMGLAGADFVGPVNLEDAKSMVRSRFEGALPNGSPDQRLALGTIDGEHGNPQAAIDYAIAHENTEMALRYLRRMDRRQIDTLLADWNADHPNGPSLYQRLGLFNHHWSVWNMNGAVFSGDEANELELAFMGVPQNDRERGEVALRTMNQQIEQSTRLGRFLAGDEYDRLRDNRSSLLRLMGHSNGNFGSDGRLRATDRVTGMTMQLGNFDAQGNLIPATGSSYSAYERMMALASITATDFTQAVDAAANFVATLLVVAAAVITTALTGGAAASIWIPMLVTAAAGLAGVAMTAAIKGGRYSKDDVTRDLIMVAVQTITAGVGAAGSVFARGGMPALRAAAGQGIRTGFKISEVALEQLVARGGGTLAASASLGADLAIGVASGAISGGGAVLADPRNWRSGELGSRFLGGVFRGGAGGAVGAGAARGVAAGMGALGNRLSSAAVARTARGALLSGTSRDVALARAMLASRQMNYVTSAATRSLASGISSSASRITELGLEGKTSWSDMLTEARNAFLQGAIQGAMEHFVDPANRNPFRRSGGAMTDAEVQGLPSWQRDEQRHLRAMAEQATAEHFDKPMRAAAPVPDGGNTATLPTSRPANDNDPAAPPVRAGAPDSDIPGRVTTPALRGDNDPGPLALHSPLTDETSGPSLRLRDEPEANARMRSALGDDDNLPPTRREGGGLSDPDKTPPMGTPIPHPTFPDGVDLRPGMLDPRLPILPDTIIRGLQPGDKVQAHQNYEIMRSAQPGHEVLLAYHPGTGDYMVIQGLPHSVTPPPEGWVTLRHTHPELNSNESFRVLTAVLPTAIGGDFSVLRSELDHLAAARPGQVVTHTSSIDITVNGSRVETVFSITKHGDNYTLSVTLNPPQHGVMGVAPITGTRDSAIRDYAYRARDLSGGAGDFGLTKNPNASGNLMTADGQTGGTSRVVRGATLSEAETHLARLAAGGSSEIAPLSGHQGEAARAAARIAAADDPHSAVRALGLVGEPDSLARLTRLLNADEPGFTAEMRAALARTTLEATRAELIRTGQLGADDELLMLFRGVTGARTGDYEAGGMNLAKLGPGRDEDAGRGLYGSQDFQSALNYAGSDGQGVVLPLIVRKSELGNVVDVRSGTPLGDRWLAFVRANASEGRLMPGYPHLSGVLHPGIDMPIGLGRGGRGARFEDFLKLIAADPTLSPAVRQAAADPHITLMDLGGVASWGNDRGMLTDQFAMHHQRIADLFNEAHGFPRTGQGGGEEATPARMRSALGGDNDDEPAKVSTVPESDPTQVTTNKIVTNASEEPSFHPDHGLVVDALINAITRTGSDTPEFLAILTSLDGLNEAAFGRLLLATDTASRTKILGEIASELALGNMPRHRINETMYELGSLIGRVNKRFGVELDHVRNIAANAEHITALPANLRQLVESSPLALHLLLNPQMTNGDGETLFSIYTHRALSRKPPITDPVAFDQLVVRSVTPRRKDTVLASHAATVRNLATALGDFNAGLEFGIPLARTVTGDNVDLTASPARPLPKEVIDGLEPIPSGATLQPGTRVEVPPQGFGTFVSEQDGVYFIHFDCDHLHGDVTGIPQHLAPIFLAPGEQAGGSGARVPIRSQSDQDGFQAKIDGFRSNHAEQGLETFNAQAKTGTVAIAHVAGQDFVGTNSTLSAALTRLTLSERAQLGTILELMGVNPAKNGGRNDFIDHAELASLILARDQLGAGNMPDVVELFVDRSACANCRQNLHALAAFLGVKEIRIYYRNQRTPPPPLVIKAR